LEFKKERGGEGLKQKEDAAVNRTGQKFGKEKSGDSWRTKKEARSGKVKEVQKHNIPLVLWRGRGGHWSSF